MPKEQPIVFAGDNFVFSPAGILVETQLPDGKLRLARPANGPAKNDGNANVILAAKASPVKPEYAFTEASAKLAESVYKIIEGSEKVTKAVKETVKVAEATGKMAEGIGLATAAGAATAVTGGMLGVVLAVIAIAELAGLFDEKVENDKLILKLIEDMETVKAGIFEAAANSHEQLQEIPFGVIAAVKSSLETFLQNPSEANYRRLSEMDADASAALATLTSPAFQQQIYLREAYSDQPWYPWAQSTFEKPDLLTKAANGLRKQHPDAKIATIGKFSEQKDLARRFDYRFTLALITVSVATRVTMMKALEPEYRSTGRYRAELTRIHNSLRKLQGEWLQCFQWMPPPEFSPVEDLGDIGTYYNVMMDHHYDYGQDTDTGKWYPRFGCVDICTGLTLYYLYDTGHPLNKQGDYADVSPLTRLDWWRKVEAVRPTCLRDMMEVSGYNNFARMVSTIEELTKDPTESETVRVARKPGVRDDFPWRMAQFRWSEIEALPPTKQVSGILGEAEFERHLFKLTQPWTRTYEVTTQTVLSIPTFEISYRFFLLGVELAPGRGTIEAEALQFNFQVGPKGESRKEVLGLKATTVDYDLAALPGQSTLKFTLQPGVNVTLSLEIKERIQSGAELITTFRTDAITLEERLPSAYFDWILRNSIASIPAVEEFQEVMKSPDFKREFQRPVDPNLATNPVAIVDFVKKNNPDLFQKVQRAVLARPR